MVTNLRIISKRQQILVEKTLLHLRNRGVSQQQTLSAKEARHRKRVSYFLNGYLALLTGQVAMMQIGTYHMYSWDVFEPLACMLGLFDAILAYAFFLATARPFSFSAVPRAYLHDKDGILKDSLHETQDLIEYFQQKRVLLF